MLSYHRSKLFFTAPYRPRQIHEIQPCWGEKNWEKEKGGKQKEKGRKGNGKAKLKQNGKINV
jgi:hypothetical protein